MVRFIIDANLPYYFSLWKGEDFIHINSINKTFSDNEIWDYAQKNNLTILTKDSDFAFRVMASIPPPKVIHFKIHNMRIKKLFEFINKHWIEILTISENHKLTNVYLNRIEGIN